MERFYHLHGGNQAIPCCILEHLVANVSMAIRVPAAPKDQNLSATLMELLHAKMAELVCKYLFV